MDDYPQDALESEKSAAALVEITVDPSGKTIRCDTVQTVGDTKLAGAICPMVKRRHWKAAQSSDDTPSYALVRTLLKFWLPGKADGAAIGQLQQAPDEILTVNHLPTNAASIDVTLNVLVGADGVVQACRPDPKEKNVAAANAVCTGKIASQSAKLNDLAGSPVGYVTALKIRLVVSSK